MSTPLLQLQGLSVRYGSVQALSGIDLTVHQGELVTLLGSNGAGKSTTLRAISALVPASAGQILWRGGPLAAAPAHRLLKLGIGHCPEGRRVLGRQSVLDNLMLGAYLRRDTLRAVPAAGRAPPAAGRGPLRRRAADAGDRPGADGPARAADAG